MRQFIVRQLKLFLLVLAGYLAQVSIMPYLSIGNVTPSLLITVTAIVIVGFGMLRGLWVGAIYGIVTETMLPTVPMLNLLFYPVSALLCSLFFADKSASRLQYERSVGKAGRNRSPMVRTVLCAASNVVIYEIVNLVYMYLSGAEFSLRMIERGLTDVLSTTILTALLMIPLRKFLGFRRQEEEKPAVLRFDNRPERD